MTEAWAVSVHPHACGENWRCGSGCANASGSPPRVWGKLTIPTQATPAGRFTPTRVGKTRWRVLSFRGRPVHPHACGENNTKVRGKLKATGSPPRVWGKLLRGIVAASYDRFTPTRVGKTLWRISSISRATVHPHACGENRVDGHAHAHRAGSPPRVWGKLQGLGLHPSP